MFENLGRLHDLLLSQGGKLKREGNKTRVYFHNRWSAPVNHAALEDYLSHILDQDDEPWQDDPKWGELEKSERQVQDLVNWMDKQTWDGSANIEMSTDWQTGEITTLVKGSKRMSVVADMDTANYGDIQVQDGDRVLYRGRDAQAAISMFDQTRWDDGDWDGNDSDDIR